MIQDKNTAAVISKRMKTLFQYITTQNDFLRYMCYMTYIYTKAIPYDMYDEVFDIVDKKILAKAFEAEIIINWDGCILFCARDYFEDITKVDYRKCIKENEKYYESLLTKKREIDERLERFVRPVVPSKNDAIALF